MSEPVPSETKELQALSVQKVKVAVGLLIGHTTLRALMFQPELAVRQDCRLCREEEEASLHIFMSCLALACKRYRILCCMFLMPKNLENMKGNDLISPVANTRFGITP